MRPFNMVAGIFCLTMAVLCIDMAILAYAAGASPIVQASSTFVCLAMALVNFSQRR